MRGRLGTAILFLGIIMGCGKSEEPAPVTPSNETLSVQSVQVNGVSTPPDFSNVSRTPIVRIGFTSSVNRTSASSISFNQSSGGAVSFSVNFQNGDSVILLQPTSPLSYLTRYTLIIPTTLKTNSNKSLDNSLVVTLLTSIDSSDKFPIITDTALVELVQRKTFNYFWDFAHPLSGLARERNTSGDLITSGGSGFGIMAIITGVHRGFISRAQAISRLQTITSFLKNTAQTFHGAFPHWLNGVTGAVIPFSTKDNGADLVETSYLIQGLLCARQYFNNGTPEEVALRNNINAIADAVQWNWFRKNNENVLYWHWSPNYNWDMNVQIKGWNECLITYVLAATSNSFGIPKIVYDNGWASNGGMRNGNTYYNNVLPLGPPFGGPLFFAHYSFLGINPGGLTDAYANYQTQTLNHTKINYEYCRANPKGWYGYSDQSWGLTASDIPNGYAASSPTNDLGVIAPTAALSSFPFTPDLSMKALKFFYYKLGDKLWGDYGFYDAFSLKDPWFANSYLAIDQGPIVIMIENYRSGLLWNLFMSCPEVKAGMLALGFQSPHL